jgi:DNA polymerase-3 subunit epsilon/ATP-dependent DNA helicase DinG
VPRTFVALDLETTGVNPERDAIIEIGAIKFADGEVVEEYTTLVNPGRAIPFEITMLTGICDRDVLDKPRFEQVAGPVMRFAGGLPIVGHNVAFDLGFVRQKGLLLENPSFDTWELASILLPALPSYSLGALSQRFGVASDTVHRAPQDALATGRLFLMLADLAAQMPRAVVSEIVRLSAGSGWPAGQLFAEALERMGVVKLPRHEASMAELAPGSILLQRPSHGDPLQPREHPEPIDVDELAGMLRPGGAFEQAFAGYEHRPPQVAMLLSVAGALNMGHHLMAEAGTGTGKSVAYLLPAIAYAVRNGTRVVVSTNTINLQDQLFKKDLPELNTVLGQVWGARPPFRAALLKGRGNYLCPRRFAALKSRPTHTADELRGIARILVWLPGTETGDQSELSLPQPSDRYVWSEVSADSEGCSMERCQREMEGRCFFARARRAAEAAHVVVVNHALLMADAATGNRVLPEYHHLIVDEAHHLEDAVTDQLSFKADAYTLSLLLGALYVGEASGRAFRGPRGAGLLAEALGVVKPLMAPEQWVILRDALIGLQGHVVTLQGRLSTFWEILGEVARELAPHGDENEYGLRLRVTQSTRSQPAWVEVEVAWEEIAAGWTDMRKQIKQVRELLDGFRPVVDDTAGFDSLVEDLERTAAALDETQAQIEAWVMRPDANSVYWAEIALSERQGRRVTLRAAPLHVGPLVQENILFKNDTVVLTSATLRAAGSFDYVRDRLAAHDADTTHVGSPFNYRDSTLLYLPTDLPEPNASGFQTAIEQALISLAKATDGRLLALFTSINQLRSTARAISPALTQAGITVLSQGTGGSRYQLLETFKSGERIVLLGTRSFWEGIDVSGSALSCLVLVRLPFAVPSDPVIAARAETFDDPFYHYSVPDAILRFRQGFGRLIRTKTDRGVVVVMDKRVTSKQYGQLFLDSLPDCTVVRGPLISLPGRARDWIAGATSDARDI